MPKISAVGSSTTQNQGLQGSAKRYGRNREMTKKELIKFSGSLLFPAIDIPGFVGYPSAFGEIGICLWLLIMGVKDVQVEDKG